MSSQSPSMASALSTAADDSKDSCQSHSHADCSTLSMERGGRATSVSAEGNHEDQSAAAVDAADAVAAATLDEAEVSHPSPPPLRDYQASLVASLLRHVSDASQPRSVLLYLPTGAGKTRVAAEVMRAVTRDDGARAVFVVNRIKLVQQTLTALLQVGVPRRCIGFVAATEKEPLTEEHSIIIASIQTLAARCPDAAAVKHILPRASVVFIDEAHGATAPCYDALFERYSTSSKRRTLLVGMTATPMRLDADASLSRRFSVLLKGPSVLQLIQRGLLVPARVIDALPRDGDASRRVARRGSADALAEDALRGRCARVVSLWRSKCRPDTSTIAFAAKVSDSIALADAFIMSGVHCLHIDGGTPQRERDRAFAAFADGSLRVICSVGTLCEGFDEPRIGAVILLRETNSKALYLQQVGRGLRLFPGKAECIVLDAVGCTLRHGPITGPLGFEWEWTEDRTVAAAVGDAATASALRKHRPAWTCLHDGCLAVNAGTVGRCAACNATRTRTPLLPPAASSDTSDATVASLTARMGALAVGASGGKLATPVIASGTVAAVPADDENEEHNTKPANVVAAPTLAFIFPKPLMPFSVPRKPGR